MKRPDAESGLPHLEVYEYLVGSAAFKAVGTSDPRPAGSIPVHLRHSSFGMSASEASVYALSLSPRWRRWGAWLRSRS